MNENFSNENLQVWKDQIVLTVQDCKKENLRFAYILPKLNQLKCSVFPDMWDKWEVKRWRCSTNSAGTATSLVQSDKFQENHCIRQK